MEARRLTREERLRLRRDFDRVFREGRSVANEYLRLVYVENGLDHPRMGVVTRKRLGKAVFRNRLRRLAREFFRLNKEKFPRVDVVFYFRDGSRELRGMKYRQFEEMALRLLEMMR